MISRMETRITHILDRASRGEAQAISELFPLVYAELRSMAAAHLGNERAGHTLQPTALVNEAFMKLASGGSVPPTGKAHFLAVASRAMRQILTDHARGRNRRKRGGGPDGKAAQPRLPFDEAHCVPDSGSGSTSAWMDLEALDNALQALAIEHPRAAQVVELRYFGGLTEPEAATVLGISLRSASVDWALARGWLKRRLEGGGPS